MTKANTFVEHISRESLSSETRFLMNYTLFPVFLFASFHRLVFLNFSFPRKRGETLPRVILWNTRLYRCRMEIFTPRGLSRL